MKYNIIVYLLVLILGFSLLYFLLRENKSEIRFIQVGELFNDFQMKKELESNFQNISKQRKHILDSLEVELKVLNSRINEEGEGKALVQKFIERRENYLLKKKQFEEDDLQMQQQYNSKIQKQLNQYVADYGEKNNIDIILGAEGSGVLMYGKNEFDITEDVLKYINLKYQGKLNE